MINKDDYIKTVRRTYPLVVFSMIWEGSGNFDYYSEFFAEPYAMTDSIYSGQVMYYHKKGAAEAVRLVSEYWSKYPEFQRAIKILRRREEELIRAADEGDFAEFASAFMAFMPALILVFYADKPISDMVKNVLEKRFGVERANEYMDILNIPLEDNYYKQEEYDLVMADDLSAHVKKYEWLNSRYAEDIPYTVDQAEKRKAIIDKNRFLRDWKEGKEKLAVTIKEVKQALGSEADVVDFLQTLVYYRTQRTDAMNRSLYFFLPRFRKKAEELGLTLEQFFHCTCREVMEGKIPSKDALEERIRDFGAIKSKQGIIIVTGKEAEELRRVLAEDTAEMKEFKGTSACKGVVRGRAKIIAGSEDYEKFDEGDILITSMTTPNMILIMKKAAAFVTDEGGVTCHAAIISRELKKPCIIGTKIATQVLKDGMMVQVDAEKGEVKIIKAV